LSKHWGHVVWRNQKAQQHKAHGKGTHWETPVAIPCCHFGDYLAACLIPFPADIAAK
jgi:hypothetical protein